MHFGTEKGRLNFRLHLLFGRNKKIYQKPMFSYSRGVAKNYVWFRRSNGDRVSTEIIAHFVVLVFFIVRWILANILCTQNTNYNIE